MRGLDAVQSGGEGFKYLVPVPVGKIFLADLCYFARQISGTNIGASAFHTTLKYSGRQTLLAEKIKHGER